jgi:chitinase
MARFLYFVTILAVFVVGRVSAQLPNPALVGYWHNWNDGNAPYIDIDAVDARYNVITVAFAIPTSNTDMTMLFAPDRGTVQQFKQRIQNVQATGKKVILSVGGATATIDLTTTVNRDAFVTSIGTILTTYGFDGLDIDIEHGNSIYVNGGTIANPQSAAQINLIEAIRTIMANYRTANNRKLILTFAPETAYIQGGMSGYGSIWGGYLPIVDALRDSLDLIHVQLYNSGTMYGVDNQIYTQGTADFIVSQTEAVIKGFTARAPGGAFAGIPASKVAVGLPASTNAAGGGYCDSATISAAVNYLLGKGPRPGQYTLVNAGGYPNLRGMMTWSINWDATQANRTRYAYAAVYETLFAPPPVPVPAKVVLIRPADGVQLKVNQAQFVWRRSTPEVVSYQLDVRNNGVAVFNDSTITDTVRNVLTLPPASILVWRVRAKNVSGWGEWSDGRIVSTLPYPSRVALVAPLNTEQLKTNTAALRWQRSTPEIQKYRLQIYNAQGTVIVDSVLSDTALTYNAAPASSYTWRVMAQNASGWGEWSAIWQFKTVPFPQAVQLIGPTDAIVISRDSIVLQWKRSAPEITAYQIEVKLDTTTLVVESLITDTTLALRMLKPLDWHTWRVRAKNVSGWSAWSSRWKFRHLPVPTTVELALPADGAKIHLDSLRLTWVAARSEVTAYQLEIMNNGEAVFSDTTLVTLTKAVVGLQKDSSYTWRVRAKNQSGWGEWSAVRNVTLYKQDPTSVINEYVWKDLTIAPQPASELLEIAGIDPETPSIRVYNAAGSVVLERIFVNPASTLTLDVSQLPAGVYLVVAGRSKSFVIVQ